MHNIKIAVIGKSSAGKSALIRSFSSTPNYINSVGKGQTTRAYAEYLFLKKFDSEFPLVEARIATQSEFVENRVIQVLDKFKKEIATHDNYDVIWIREQFKNKIYDNRIKNFLLFSDDFFNVKEFLFIDNNIVEKSDKEYDKLKKELVELETETSNGELQEGLEKFYKKVYEILLRSIEERFKDNQVYVKENNISYFKFSVDEERNELFSQLLKVDEKTKSSFTGIITKVRVSSKINPKYECCLKDIEFDNITLIDTYGLDHSESIDKNMLVERYNRIFNKDYPDVSTAFLVEALHTGASNDFKKSITTLYQVKPEIMTYIVGTYIDENAKELIDKEDWLFSEDKTLYVAPVLNGKVLQILDEKFNLEATLLDQGITESMAEKRCEIMQKRFAPFCGDVSKSSGEIDYEKVNNLSIKALFLSISDREHLGDGYIEIDKIICGIDSSEVLEKFAKIFIDNVKIIFMKIYECSAARTRWKIRENLERYILGFDGTTIDATWVRVFRDAFNQTFTKPINIDEKKVMLSEILGMEGNSKIAFDEMIAMMYPYIFKRICIAEDKLDAYASEISCINCAKDNKDLSDCGWNIFMNAATFEMFGKRSDYERVIDWLNDLHQFSTKDIANFVNLIAILFKKVIAKQLISSCRERNIYIASKKLKRSLEPYISIKIDLFDSYKKSFDNNIEDKYFFEKMNEYLCK
ncbi:hypothetical protein [Clostridium gasigenes]|uniref:hypothetical protein n=1 Tax=Clostridium gasigenes TaxID=94869 RepID=UPI001C0DD085|nr:hypothetical protein [Clostridium gasigenes]MBU3105144.1 hypothetical protein [Clostridium gasigenes]